MKYLLKEPDRTDATVAFRPLAGNQSNLRLVTTNRFSAVNSSEPPPENGLSLSTLSVTLTNTPSPLTSKEFNEQGSQFDHYWLSSTRTIQIRAIDAECCQFLQDQPLTQREREILRLIVQGNSNAEIARKLYVSNGTVKTHLRKLFTKLAVRDRTQAAVFALRAGLVD
jgi:DNA-binding CsgD family transcriptional regulator